MSTTIYKEIILDHYKNPRNFGALEGVSKKAQVSNPVCGDDITISLLLTGNTVTDIRFSGQGCAIAMASASMLTEYAKNKEISHLQSLDAHFMLTLLSVELSASRLKCALVSLEALQKAL